MFSTAFATIKFLSETRPKIGFSSFLGTADFLNSSLYLYLFAIENETHKDFKLIGINMSAYHLGEQ